MPNIKGMRTTDKGDIEITPLTDKAVTLTKASIDLMTVDKDLGASEKTISGFDTYYYCYVDEKMKRIDRTVTLVINKGVIPPKNWWVQEEVKIG